MTDKFLDPKTGKELFRINDDNKMETTEEGTLSFLLKDVEYWESQVSDQPTSRAKEALDLAKSRLKRFQEGKESWD
jgi:hypothetical protein